MISGTDASMGRLQPTDRTGAAGMAEAIAALTAYRDRLKARGRLLEARAVGYCIRILRG